MQTLKSFQTDIVDNLLPNQESYNYKGEGFKTQVQKLTEKQLKNIL